MNHPWKWLIGSIFIAFVLAGCGAQGDPGPVGPAGPAGPVGPQGPAGDSATARQTYIGSEQCGACHEETFDKFIRSGHPYKLTKIEDGQAPTYPFDELTGGVADPPEGYTWDDITYVIGGFAWKARFIDENGFIITGDEDATTQYNYANERVGTDAEWVPYHAGEELPYDCGSCHTTGYSPDGHQDDLEGIIGTWEIPGIQCEECHGPGSGHAEDPYGISMHIDRESQLCGECHIRDNPSDIDASDGFIKHHEQFEELFSSKHFALSCVTCHDPHASAVYADEDINPDKGIIQECESCHWAQEFQNNTRHSRLECVDCHMPPIVKSAVGDLENYTADLRSHLFSINPDGEATQFDEESGYSKPYITLTYACLQCHNGTRAGERDMETLTEMARGYHTMMPPTPTPTLEPTPTPTPEGTPEATPES